MELLQHAHTVSAFARTRWLQARLRSKSDVRRYQDRQLARLARAACAAIPFCRDLPADRFEAWPVVDKAQLLANFEKLNCAGITLAEVRQALASGQDRVRGYVVGQSTGTSGNRGYFVASDAERFTWLGTLLAKTLPDALWRRHKVALAMPGMSSLYRSSSQASRIALGFFPLADGVEAWAEEFVRFDADTIVAPPKVLRRLAEEGRLAARHIFSGAEVLDPLDRAVIEGITGQVVREIYMATEGLFGVACRFGTLHLAEDLAHFAWEFPVSGSELRMPVVTDFVRRAQLMARYRMNDLLELSQTPCSCGSPLQAVRRIEGRRDDVFELRAADGNFRLVTPDILRNAVVDADPRIQDFRILQTGPETIEVQLPEALKGAADGAVSAALAGAARRLGVAPAIVVRAGIATPYDRKLRRVMRLWKPD
jgi:putative adenylate-forming enzyme